MFRWIDGDVIEMYILHLVCEWGIGRGGGTDGIYIEIQYIKVTIK